MKQANDELISVIIPVYNTPGIFLRECIESVLNQTYVPIEMLIVDDCSENLDTLNVISEYSASCENIQEIRLECNSGSGAARNRGLDCSKGKYVFFHSNCCLIYSIDLSIVKEVA